MIVSVRVNVSGPVRTLQAMRQAFAPTMAPQMRAAFQQVADRYDRYIMDRFDRVSQSGGVGEWAPLKPGTVAEKKREGKPSAILVRDHALRDSLDPGHPLHVRQQLPNGIRTGSKEKKLRIHQVGAKARNLPARPVIVPPHPQLVRELTGILAEGMRKVIAAANAAAPRLPGVSNPPSMN
jgi:hypothetical protein